jgi:hypothetical protein
VHLASNSKGRGRVLLRACALRISVLGPPGRAPADRDGRREGGDAGGRLHAEGFAEPFDFALPLLHGYRARERGGFVPGARGPASTVPPLARLGSILSSREEGSGETASVVDAMRPLAAASSAGPALDAPGSVASLVPLVSLVAATARAGQRGCRPWRSLQGTFFLRLQRAIPNPHKDRRKKQFQHQWSHADCECVSTILPHAAARA